MEGCQAGAKGLNLTNPDFAQNRDLPTLAQRTDAPQNQMEKIP
jgi:hypothetical protein